METKEIKTGDILLVSSKSWLARQIQKFQRRISPNGYKFNHASVFWWSYNELMVIEADKPGIVITPFKDYVNSDRELLVLKPTWKIDGSELGNFMLQYVGRSHYGFWNLLVAQSVRILTGNRLWLGPTDDYTKRFICGQFACFCMHHTRADIFMTWNEAAPSDIFDHPDFTHHPFVK